MKGDINGRAGDAGALLLRGATGWRFDRIIADGDHQFKKKTRAI